MGQRFQLALQSFWKPKVHIHIWRIFFSFQIIPKYVNAAATWKIYIEIFTPRMNSVTPTGETNRCPLTFCSAASDICAAFDIFSNGCGKPFFFFFFVWDKASDNINPTEPFLARRGSSWVPLFPLTFMLAWWTAAAVENRKSTLICDARWREKKKKKISHSPEAWGSRLRRLIRGDINRCPALIYTRSHLPGLREGELLCRGCLRVETTVTTELSPLICAQLFQVSWRIVTHTDTPPPSGYFSDECVLTNKCKCVSEASF